MATKLLKMTHTQGVKYLAGRKAKDNSRFGSRCTGLTRAFVGHWFVGLRLCLQGMEQQWGVAPNVYHYTSLVTCLLKAGQWSEAIAITDRMEVS